MGLLSRTPFAPDWYISARLVAEHLPEDGIVLDVGTGPGIKARFVFGDRRGVIAIDRDLAEARKAKGRLGSSLRADGCRLPFQDGSLAGITSFHSIEHLDARAFLAEARRVLRPSGTLILVTPNRRRPSACWSWVLRRFTRTRFPLNPDHVWEFTRPELISALAQAGFDVPWIGGILLGALVRCGGRFISLGLSEPPAALDRHAAMIAAVARKP